ncbi:hypothetical protein HA402_001112 [Bradysia odoriphaga]|nr:hypothetical protein HA402_001112 [Bradysia odoriphaga]
MKGNCVVCNAHTELKCQGCVERGVPSVEIQFYCGKEHQTVDWKNGHNRICSAKTKSKSIGFHVYQFKITLVGAEAPIVGDMIEPPIWRRIQIKKNSNFRDLHKAISISMGWFESHLHEFRTASGDVIGMPHEEDFGMPKKTIPERSVKLVTHFKNIGDRCVYEYDFGDGWIHEILLEGIQLADDKVAYPTCVGGERACPPEDVGGVYGYSELIAAYQKPSNARNKKEREMIDWVKNHSFGYKNFHPDRFVPSEVKWNMFNSSVWEK